MNLQNKLWNFIIKNILVLSFFSIFSYSTKLLLKKAFHLGKGKKASRKALEEVVEEYIWGISDLSKEFILHNTESGKFS